MSRGLLALVESRLVGEDLALELERAGWEVERLPRDALGIESFRHYVRSRAPKALVSVNHSPELAWLATWEGLTRYVSWTVDPLPVERLRVLDGTRMDDVRIFLHRSSQVPLFRSLGFPCVQWLPLAAPRRRFEQAPESRERQLPASFVGSSLADETALFEQALARWGVSGSEAEPLRGAIDGIALAALDDFSFQGFSPGGCDVPARLLEFAGEDPPLVAEALNARISATFRAARVRACAAMGGRVHGDARWRDIVGEAWKGALPDGLPLTRVYAGSLANVDVPRIHQRDIATLRAFDVAASGGCLVAEPSTDLVSLFEPGREFLPYRDGSELAAALGRLAADPALSMEIGARARSRAVAEHTLESRALRIAEGLEGL